MTMVIPMIAISQQLDLFLDSTNDWRRSDIAGLSRLI